MKTRSLVVTLALCVLALTVSLAQNANLGTWKLNEAKSSVPAGMGKTTTVLYAAEGDSIRVTGDGVDTQGKPTHTEWTGKFDAKPYPLTGDASANYRAYKAKNDHLLLFANMQGDKTVSNGKIIMAKDGKSRTVELNYLEGKNKVKLKGKLVYEKQ